MATKISYTDDVILQLIQVKWGGIENVSENELILENSKSKCVLKA